MHPHAQGIKVYVIPVCMHMVLLHHAHLPLRSQLHSCHDSDVCPSILFGMFRFKLVAPNLMPFAYSFRSMTVSSHIPCKTFMEYTYTYACTRVVIKLRCTHKPWCLEQLLFPVIVYDFGRMWCLSDVECALNLIAPTALCYVEECRRIVAFVSISEHIVSA
jgi:hypothetical protein